MHDKQRVEAQAREWLAYLYSGEATEAGEQRFAAWLKESGVHARAYSRCEQIWRDIGGTQDGVGLRGTHLALAQAPVSLTGAVARATEGAAGSTRRVTAGTRWLAMAAAVAFVAIALAWWLAAQRVTGTRLSTGAGELRTVSLSDGSRITLGPSSAVVVRISDRLRQVDLAAGRAFFAVAHGDSRRFSVTAGATEARVTGTQFEVRRRDGGADVAVAEGSVEVSAESHNVVRLRAGDAVSSSNGQLLPVHPVDPATVFSWRSGRLVYVDTPLGEVLRDVNPFRTSPIVLATPELGTLRVTASFRTDQTDRLLTALLATQPVTLERAADRVVLRAAPPPPAERRPAIR